MLVLARPWAGQMAAWAAAALAPRLVISVMTAPGRATAAATRKGVVHPGGERGVADPGDLAGELGRRVAGYGRCAGRDRAFHAGQLGGAERGRCAACQLAGSMVLILAGITAPRTAVRERRQLFPGRCRR